MGTLVDRRQAMDATAMRRAIRRLAAFIGLGFFNQAEPFAND